jgi:hypothetical protein
MYLRRELLKGAMIATTGGVILAATRVLQAGVILPYRVKEYIEAAKAAAIPA